MESVRYRSQYRVLMLVSIFLLVAFSLPMLYSTSAPVHGNKFFLNQSLFVFTGAIVAYVIHLVDYRVIGSYGKYMLIACCCALSYLLLANLLSKTGNGEIAAKFPFIKAIKGSYRWFRFGGFGVQPAEFTKIALIIFLAEYYHVIVRKMDDWKHSFGKPFLIGVTVMATVLFGGSLSMTVLTGTVLLTIMFIAGVGLRWLVGCICAGACLVGAAALISPVRMARFQSFLNPEELQMDKGYQLWHSLLALGSGGWTGQGFAESRMKNEYLPEAHTDFILAIVGEELGFISLFMVCMCYLLFLFSVLKMSSQAKDLRGIILTAGLGCAVVQHALVNIGVVCGMGPTTGITAPFVSYGGSSMWSAFISIGLIMSVDKVARGGAYVPEQKDLPPVLMGGSSYSIPKPEDGGGS